MPYVRVDEHLRQQKFIKAYSLKKRNSLIFYLRQQKFIKAYSQYQFYDDAVDLRYQKFIKAYSPSICLEGPGFIYDSRNSLRLIARLVSWAWTPEIYDSRNSLRLIAWISGFAEDNNLRQQKFIKAYSHWDGIHRIPNLRQQKFIKAYSRA